MPTYEDARAVCAMAGAGEFTLPEYAGSPDDFAYLKNYVLGLVTDIYGVDVSVFDTPTVYSTAILRDFVHRAIYQSTTHEYIDDIAARGDLLVPQTEDVATAFRYPAWGLCGLLAWQEYQVFVALGYETNLLAVINDDIGSFTDSHSTTEVFCEDVNGFIIQDATFNFLFENTQGNPLSWRAASNLTKQDGLAVEFDAFDVYTYYRSSATSMADVSPELEELFREHYFKGPLLWADDGAAPGADGNLFRLFPNWQTAHDPDSSQGATYASTAAFMADIAPLEAAGRNWNEIGGTLNDTHYVSGFRIIGGGEWLTARLDDGAYVSVEIHSGTVINGSYDQVMNDITGNDRDLNPGLDLSFLFTAADVLAWDGTVMHRPTETAQASPNVLPIRNIDTGALRMWDVNGSASSAASFGSPDKNYILTDRGDYDGDGLIDLLFTKSTTGETGYWDENRSWHRLDKLTSAWEQQSHTGTSDLWGDGADDILWRNTANGQVVVWNMFDGDKVGYKSYGTLSAAWQVAGMADINGDGTDDILWRNSTTGELRKWIMENGVVAVNSRLDILSLGWQVIGTGDFRDDRSYDILWKNATTGAVVLWDMDNGVKSSASQLDILGPNWEMAAAIDLTPGGADDMLWRNTANGEIYYWEMDAGVKQTLPNGVLGLAWDIA